MQTALCWYWRICCCKETSSILSPIQITSPNLASCRYSRQRRNFSYNAIASTNKLWIRLVNGSMLSSLTMSWSIFSPFLITQEVSFLEELNCGKLQSFVVLWQWEFKDASVTISTWETFETIATRSFPSSANISPNVSAMTLPTFYENSSAPALWMWNDAQYGWTFFQHMFQWRNS